MKWVVPKTLNIVATDLADTANLTDGKISTQVSKLESFYVKLDQGLVDTISLLNTVGTSVQIDLINKTSNEIEKTYNIDLRDDSFGDIWSYFYDEFIFKIDFALNVILTYEMYIKITVNNPGSDAKLGLAIVGQASKNFYMLSDHTPNMLDYSQVTRNDSTGDVTFNIGNYAKKLSLTMVIDNADFSRMVKRLYAIRGKEILFIGDGGEHTIVYGFIRNFDGQYSFKNKEYIGLDIEGLI